VDDDAKVLTAEVRSLGERFRIDTAASGDEALDLVRRTDYAVVVSDLKMPGMDGIRFLTRVRELRPDTVRMVLTGFATRDNAIDAVNDGYVFRFLTKPCPTTALRTAIEAGVAQFRLIRDQAELQGLRKVHRAMAGIIQGFTSLVEARDPYTAGHQRKVTALSLAMARHMGCDEDTLNGLGMAAMVHDIGKLYVPAEFLNKPGKLTEAEFSIIKSHPKVGFDILDPVDFPWPISRIVLQHHERVDGSGYPQGLAGAQILPEARILAVADVVDAIQSHRPYRPGRGRAAALEEIREGRGALYDPGAVAACLAVVDQVDVDAGPTFITQPRGSGDAGRADEEEA
jgi:putative nucleotidyltransferase with HDIG domain